MSERTDISTGPVEMSRPTLGVSDVMATSLKVTDAESAANATAPRVSLADIERAIAEKHFFLASEAVMAKGHPCGPDLAVLTICLVTFTNGFTVIGKAAPADAQNFNPELGRKFALEDALRQAWPLFGFELRSRLERGERR